VYHLLPSHCVPRGSGSDPDPGSKPNDWPESRGRLRYSNNQGFNNTLANRNAFYVHLPLFNPFLIQKNLLQLPDHRDIQARPDRIPRLIFEGGQLEGHQHARRARERAKIYPILGSQSAISDRVPIRLLALSGQPSS